MTDRMLSFRELLKPGTPFRLDHFLEQAFQKSKAVIVRDWQGTRIFDLNKPTCLATDWSKNGIRFLLFKNIVSVPKQSSHSAVLMIGNNVSGQPIH